MASASMPSGVSLMKSARLVCMGLGFVGAVLPRRMMRTGGVRVAVAPLLQGRENVVRIETGLDFLADFGESGLQRLYPL